MIFQFIKIKEGFNERTFNFKNGANLVFSEANSTGKTTLLRFLLYSIGFNIPNTRKIRFDQCEVQVQIYSDTAGELVLTRYSRDFVETSADGVRKTYVLPDQLHDLHKIIFNTDNVGILNNLLGAIYADQEKGWTLLNRGTVIGSIRFNIEELIRGLSGCDCSDLIHKEAQLSRELAKYRQIFSVAKYREELVTKSGTLVVDSYAAESDAAISQLLIQQKGLQSELKRIDKSLSDNRHVRQFVDEMKLMIQLPNGVTVLVTSDNIVGLTDTTSLLITKRKIVSSELRSVAHQLSSMQKEQEREEQQLEFFQSESMINIFDKKIASLPIDTIAVGKRIKELEKVLTSVRHEISCKTKSDTKIIKSLYENMVKYSTELGVGNSSSIASSYLFTSNLKELSGAILHKTVFAFRLAYILEIEKNIGIKLPIILDSPSGKEVDQTNIRLMINILKRDFTDNQVIVASIFHHDLGDMNVINLQSRLIEG